MLVLDSSITESTSVAPSAVVATGLDAGEGEAPKPEGRHAQGAREVVAKVREVELSGKATAATVAGMEAVLRLSHSICGGTVY